MRLITRSLKTVICLGLLASASAQGDDNFSDMSSDLVPSGQSRLSVVDQDQVATLLRPSDDALQPEDSLPRMQFNLAAAKAVQKSEAGVQVQQVGCLAGGCAQSNDCDCDVSAEVCTPRRAVQLPTSTFHEYFSSDRCNTGVWDGYSRKCTPLTIGKRGCLGGCESGCGEVLPPRPRQIRVLESSASSCDVPACDAPGCDG